MREGAQLDPLFVACTRPAMLAGVPDTAAVIIAGISMLVNIAGSVFVAVPTGILLWLVARLIAAFDPHAFSMIFAWMNTKGRAGNGRHWQCVSRSPLPLSPRTTDRKRHR